MSHWKVLNAMSSSSYKELFHKLYTTNSEEMHELLPRGHLPEHTEPNPLAQ